jgi:PPOX class probable F420-dependent enzyme
MAAAQRSQRPVRAVQPVGDRVVGVGLGQRLAHGMDRAYDCMRDPSVFEISADDASSGPLDPIRDHKYALLVTFRRNGDPVPSPVWVAVDAAGRAYTQTSSRSGKVKRVRNDPTALIAASNVRGRPVGPILRAAVRILPREEWPHAEATLAGAFGLGRKLYQGIFPMRDEVVGYLEVVSDQTRRAADIKP